MGNREIYAVDGKELFSVDKKCEVSENGAHIKHSMSLKFAGSEMNDSY